MTFDVIVYILMKINLEKKCYLFVQDIAKFKRPN